MATDINDGYTETALIAEFPRVHPALKFSYRPALPEEIAELYDKAPKQSGKQFQATMAAWLTQRIVKIEAEAGCFIPSKDWQFQGNDPVSGIRVNAALILHLRPRLFNRMRDIVLGDAAPDEGATSNLEEDAKNSSPGSPS